MDHLRQKKENQETSHVKDDFFSLLVANDAVELDDGFLLFGSEGPALDVGAEIVRPSETAALAASKKTCINGASDQDPVTVYSRGNLLSPLPSRGRSFAAD